MFSSQQPPISGVAWIKMKKPGASLSPNVIAPNLRFADLFDLFNLEPPCLQIKAAKLQFVLISSLFRPELSNVDLPTDTSRQIH